jgi:hypothetical protein
LEGSALHGGIEGLLGAPVLCGRFLACHQQPNDDDLEREGRPNHHWNELPQRFAVERGGCFRGENCPKAGADRDATQHGVAPQLDPKIAGGCRNVCVGNGSSKAEGVRKKPLIRP